MVCYKSFKVKSGSERDGEYGIEFTYNNSLHMVGIDNEFSLLGVYFVGNYAVGKIQA